MYPNIKTEKVRIFKTASFARWARKEKLSDELLRQTIIDLQSGLVDAHLGSGLIKKRVAKRGTGKRSGYRVLLAFHIKDRAIFIFGFSKNERENLDLQEKEIYRKLAKNYLSMPLSALEEMCKKNLLLEVKYHEK